MVVRNRRHGREGRDRTSSDLDSLLNVFKEINMSFVDFSRRILNVSCVFYKLITFSFFIIFQESYQNNNKNYLIAKIQSKQVSADFEFSILTRFFQN